MARTEYTSEQKAEALAIYVTDGLAAAVERTGIPKGTIAAWAHRTGTQTYSNERQAAAAVANRLRWADRRAKLVDEIGDVAALALEQAQGALTTGRARDARDFATTLAILVDKAQLLGGDATERMESRQLRNELLAEARENAKHLRSVA